MPEWEKWPEDETVIGTKCLACGGEFDFKWADVVIEDYKGADRPNEYLITCPNPECGWPNRYRLKDIIR